VEWQGEKNGDAFGAITFLLLGLLLGLVHLTFLLVSCG